jgi:hypothetical protein
MRKKKAGDIIISSETEEQVIKLKCQGDSTNSQILTTASYTVFS